MVAASSPALESAPAVTTTAPSPQGPGCSRVGGRRSAQLWGHPVAGASCVLPGSAYPGGSTGSWAVPPDALGSLACAAGIALLGPCSPFSADLPRELLPWPGLAHAPAV